MKRHTSRVSRPALFGLLTACFLASPVYSYAQTNVDLLTQRSPIAQPYKYVTGGQMSGAAVDASPDPLVSYVWDQPKATDSLQVYVVHPVSAEAVSGAGNFTGLSTVGAEQCAVKVKGTGVIRLDFGTELPAWIEVDSPDLTGDVEFGISEYNVSVPLGKVKKPVRYNKTYRLELNKELYEGVRYGFIYVNKFAAEFNITSIRAVCQVKPTNYTGSFDTDNPMLNRIWYVGAYDVKANLREDCFGAILIDRGDRFSWTGDAYPAQAASMVAFSNYDEVLKNLYWTESHPNGIETYELYWVESLLDYYLYSGDEDGFRALLPKAVQRLKHAFDVFDNPPDLHFVGWDQRLGTGFDHPNCSEGIWTFKMCAIGAWKHMAAVMRTLGEEAQATIYERWAKVKGVQCSTASVLRQLGMHSSADAINADLVADLSKLYHKDFSDREQRLSLSPFNQYFVLKAMARAGHYDDAFASVFDEWGGQIEYGGTCYFEVFRPDWAKHIGTNGPIPHTQAGVTSLAHPWGAGVVAWLSEEMLGIKPTAAGFSTFTVKPHLAGAAKRVSGQTMTPHGAISASFDLQSGQHRLSVPEGTVGTLCLPKEGMSMSHVMLNGKQLESYAEDADFVYLPDLQPGQYEASVVYEGTPTEMKTEEWKYAMDIKEIDRTTHGRWFEKYGKDGYVIVGGQDNGDDLEKLPSYVSSVVFDLGIRNVLREHRAMNLTPITPEAMIPVSDAEGARKVLNCYYSRGTQMVPVEVRLKYNHPYRLAVYTADCDKGGRDYFAEAFDLETMNRLTPCTRVKDMEGGVYLIYEYNRSIRVMLNNIRGDNTLINAVFFDGASETAVGAVTRDEDRADESIAYSLSGIPMQASTQKSIHVVHGKKFLR